MKRVISILLISVMLHSVVYAQQSKNSQVEFYKGSYDNFLRKAQQLSKPVLIEFWASWCGPCKKMEAETYSDANLADFVNKNFLVYRIDIDSNEGMEIVEKFGIKVFPTVLVADYRGKEIAQLSGFYSAKYFENSLEKLNDEHFLYHDNEYKDYASN
ncbi:thioredoxin family protein [Jiulongibacter sediminis]|uniref:Thioredoxin domain-containing protein n=1 Tax=Jiulongibacter sediminis TaxID=1605367 RepID=A0A0N8H978_9BACT|nr:thioredoxin family protein [Jiulongibacter sediminis]KPM46612.1 hypothetical protein AFM12_18905 [Jiulongibacter sediminis]TBX21470.1 hypothetical protein TK44_18910 [Jiulongibacter sediminis]